MWIPFQGERCVTAPGRLQYLVDSFPTAVFNGRPMGCSAPLLAPEAGGFMVVLISRAKGGHRLSQRMEGVVMFSGLGPDGYGNVVMLDHGDSLMTLYAHNERNVVRQGERVRRGQIVALMGDTGRASGTHVHFEVHQHGRLLIPYDWLH